MVKAITIVYEFALRYVIEGGIDIASTLEQQRSSKSILFILPSTFSLRRFRALILVIANFEKMSIVILVVYHLSETGL